MSLYAVGQRVWVKSHQSLGIIEEARYTRATTLIGRKAEYVVRFVSGVQRWNPASGRLEHEPVPNTPNFMTGSHDLRAADWCCDGCSRWLPGRPHVSNEEVGICFLCVEESKSQPIGMYYE